MTGRLHMNTFQKQLRGFLNNRGNTNYYICIYERCLNMQISDGPSITFGKEDAGLLKTFIFDLLKALEHLEKSPEPEATPSIYFRSGN